MKLTLTILTLTLLMSEALYAIERISIDSDTVVLSDGYSDKNTISRDGRFVAFISSATNLVSNDTNDDEDIFIHDRQNNTLERVMPLGFDNLHLSYSDGVSISDDARYVVFVSLNGLLPIDTNGKYDVYMVDRSDNTLHLISYRKADGLIGDGNSQEASISADGRYIVFMSTSTFLLPQQTTNKGNVFLYSIADDEVIVNLSAGVDGDGGNGTCRYPRITADGQSIVFESHASNLVDNDTNGKRDFFIKRGGSPIIRVDARYSTVSSTPSDSSISDDGRYLVFASALDTLVANDTNGVTDIFMYDKNSDVISRIIEDGYGAYISGDGSYVTFRRGISSERKIYRYNLSTQIEELISVNTTGDALNDESRHAKMSADGNFIVFETRATNVNPLDSDGKLEVVVHDYAKSTTDIMSGHIPNSNDSSGTNTGLSEDGRYVVFDSNANNLVANDTNNKKDVFLRDRKNNTIERISVSSSGVQGNGDSKDASVSADGRYVTFLSYATNLVVNDTNAKGDIFLHDRQTGITTRVSKKRDGSQNTGQCFSPSINTTGTHIVFDAEDMLDSSDTNGKKDIYMYTISSGEIKLISVASDGTVGDGVSVTGSVSADGKFVAFSSYANNFSTATGAVNLPQIFLKNIQDNTMQCISLAPDGSEGNDRSTTASISADAKYIVFQSYATNLLNSNDANGGKVDIFLYDLEKAKMELISKSSSGQQANDTSYLSYGLSISKNGRYITFRSGATNLVADDTNGVYDAFLHDRKSGSTIRLSINNNNEEGNLLSYAPSISPSGNYATFLSQSSNLVPGDNNNKSDVFGNENTLYKAKSKLSPSLIMYLLN